MRYRGFDITITRKENYAHCEIFTAEDKEHLHTVDEIVLPVGEAISDTSNESAQPVVINLIDNNILEMLIAKEEIRRAIAMERLGRAVCYIGEQESGEALYDTLKNEIGMTEDEIREIGFTSLVPYFDKDSYAQTIADYLTDTGTEKTESGNRHFSFDEINKRFAVSLPEDRELLESIVAHLDPEIVSDVDTTEDFDLMFYLQYCPYAEDEDMDMSNLLEPDM